jgi:hypothetical protein
MIKVNYQKLMNCIKIKIILMMKKMSNAAQARILMKFQMIIIKAKKKKKMKLKINIFKKINMRKNTTKNPLLNNKMFINTFKILRMMMILMK